MKFHNTNTRGFTLIDILLTAAIVSLLSSLFLFQVSEARRKADDSHMKVEAQQVSNAIALYKNDNNGRVPLSVNAQAGDFFPETGEGYKESMQLLVSGGYIPEIPTSPDGQSYTYAVDENNNAFFAFKLKQGNVSSNRKNSCSVAVTASGGEKTFTSCQSQSGCTESAGVACFVPGSYMASCGCNTSTVYSLNPTVIPDQLCALSYICVRQFPWSSTWVLTVDFYSGGGGLGGGGLGGPVPAPTMHMCTYTLSTDTETPACDGSSTGDYCECI